MICSLVFGALLLPVFAWYDTQYADYPILPMRVLKNRSICAGCMSSLFSFFTFFMYDIYLTSYWQVGKHASVAQAGYAINSYSFGSTSVAILAGFAIRYTKKLKWSLILGQTLNVIGTASMAWAVTSAKGMWASVLCLVVLSIGGGFFNQPGQATVQSNCRPQDVGATTALYLTFSMLGSSVGSAIAGALWAPLLRRYLRAFLPADLIPEIDHIANDINVAKSYQPGTPARLGIDQAYGKTLQFLALVAIIPAVCGLACAFFMHPSPISSQDKKEGAAEAPLSQRSSLGETSLGDPSLGDRPLGDRLSTSSRSATNLRPVTVP